MRPRLPKGFEQPNKERSITPLSFVETLALIAVSLMAVLGALTIIPAILALLGPNVSTFYKRPVHIVKGEDVWLWDADGRRYLDCYNNVPHVGHCNPRVVEAICSQSAQLNVHSRYLHEGIVAFAERLRHYNKHWKDDDHLTDVFR